MTPIPTTVEQIRPGLYEWTSECVQTDSPFVAVLTTVVDAGSSKGGALFLTKETSLMEIANKVLLFLISLAKAWKAMNKMFADMDGKLTANVATVYKKYCLLNWHYQGHEWACGSCGGAGTQCKYSH